MLLRLCLALLVAKSSLITAEGDLNLKNVKLVGPGLHPDVIRMPARYFYIETGLDYDSSTPYIKNFEVLIIGVNTFGGKCRVWVNIMDTKNGSLIVRYKLYDTCFKFQIHVMYDGEHLGSSPFVYNKPVQPEDCNCPDASFKSWHKNYKCRNKYEQLENDLLPFKTVDYTKIRPTLLSLFDRPTQYSLCNYVVYNNEIYRKCYGKYVQFNMFIDSILLSLTRKVKLPNIEFFANLGDWPLSAKAGELIPIFSWCGSNETNDIVMPTYDLTESSLENMGRVMLDMLSVQGNINQTWDNKIPKIFWRGRDSNRRRLDLIDIARKYPDFFNVSLTNFFFFRTEMAKYGPKTDHVSFFEFFDYKYQLNVDGTVAAYRFPYLLAGDSVVFKQDSKYYEWYYNLLKPFHHYIPVKEDLSDLYEQLQWAIANDDKAHQIAIQGQKFARENLLPHNIFCYYASLFSKWSNRIVSEIKVHDGMEKVSQPESKAGCHCQQMRDEL